MSQVTAALRKAGLGHLLDELEGRFASDPNVKYALGQVRDQIINQAEVALSDGAAIVSGTFASKVASKLGPNAGVATTLFGVILADIEAVIEKHLEAAR